MGMGPQSMNVCVPLACRAAELGAVSVCPSGNLCWCCHKDFAPKSGKGAQRPTLLFPGQGSLLSCLPQGLACAECFIPPGWLAGWLAGWRFFSPEPQARLHFLGGGAGCSLHLVCQRNTRAPCQQ